MEGNGRLVRGMKIWWGSLLDKGGRGGGCLVGEEWTRFWLLKQGLPPVGKTFKKNFMAPFYGRGSTASRLEPLRGGSLLFTTKFPEISGTHFTDLGWMKG